MEDTPTGQRSGHSVARPAEAFTAAFLCSNRCVSMCQMVPLDKRSPAAVAAASTSHSASGEHAMDMDGRRVDMDMLLLLLRCARDDADGRGEVEGPVPSRPKSLSGGVAVRASPPPSSWWTAALQYCVVVALTHLNFRGSDTGRDAVHCFFARVSRPGATTGAAISNPRPRRRMRGGHPPHRVPAQPPPPPPHTHLHLGKASRSSVLALSSLSRSYGMTPACSR